MHKTILKKEFNKTHLTNCEFIKDQSKKIFNLNPGNNICLLLEKIEQTKKLLGCYVECGTFEGGTLLPVALYNKHFYVNKVLYGMDSFEGFPISEHHPNDLPEKFLDLHFSGLISSDHLKKAKDRTQNLKSLKHLDGEYFEKINDIFENIKHFKSASLIKGPFSSTTPKFQQKISLLHLDCDLYESYLVCLDNLYDNVINNGVIVFDEYYSHKYPGARIAVNEFFSDKSGHFEYYITSEEHERWCFVKHEN